MEGRELHRSARAKVRGEIAQRIRAHAPVPEVISSLLYEGWQDVLLAAYLRGGTEGQEWHKAMGTVDRLLWSVQPKVEYADRRELLRGIPELLRTLRESLAGVSYDQRRLARWFKELQALHIAALRGTGPAQADADSPAFAPADAAPSAEPRAGAHEVHPPTPLTVGTWAEILRGDGGRLRVKLAWRSPESGAHLFVDRAGRRAMELSASELSSLLERGSMTVLGEVDAPLVDRAMESLLHSLKSG
jgi:hypothetical protein